MPYAELVADALPLEGFAGTAGFAEDGVALVVATVFAALVGTDVLDDDTFAEVILV